MAILILIENQLDAKFSTSSTTVPYSRYSEPTKILMGIYIERRGRVVNTKRRTLSVRI
jgi:hypothetical protein